MRAHSLLLLMLVNPLAAAGAQRPGVSQEIERALSDTRRELGEIRVSLAPLSDGLAGLRGYLDFAMVELSTGLLDNELSLAWPDWEDRQPDPADSLYRRARQALNAADYTRAADAFRELRRRYPRSTYVPDSYYWESYARFKQGSARASTDQLRQAARLLDELRERHPRSDVLRHARSLEADIQGELAQLGDREAAEYVTRTAGTAVAAPVPPVPPTPPTPVAAPGAPAPAPVPGRPPRGGGRTQRDACGDDDDVQAQALQALMQMDGDKALPILEKVLARRDAGSECLRRKAVFIVSQIDGRRVEPILLGVVRSDPDREVRAQAVFWLSQVDSEEAVSALDSILTRTDDREIQEKAIFALSQHDSRTARQALRRYAERNDAPEELREKAVFWIGQSDDPENAQFLRNLFGRVTSQELKDKIIFSISQTGDAGATQFLTEVARNTSQPIEIRKKALFWLGQKDDVTGTDLAALYGTFSDPEIKEQLIFTLSQKDDRAAVDKLIDIARREPDRELRKKAVFWLGQSNDPRVPELMAEILTKP
ncbi:MAG TPA: HEAT repeat domain-containing protein [Gemmatimonadales bacterium]|nr:HEAT repeat domain-containing protein [Gemmatimonadales bacterium]